MDDGGAGELVRQLLAEGVPLRARETALKRLAVMMTAAAPVAGHVELVEELFLRYMVLPQKQTGAAALASTEELRAAMIELVTELFSAVQLSRLRGGPSPPLANLTVLVLQTLLTMLPRERSNALRVAGLKCVLLAWQTSGDGGALVGFLPGTAAGLVSVLESRSLSGEAGSLACAALAECIRCCCADAESLPAAEKAADPLADLRRRAEGKAGVDGLRFSGSAQPQRRPEEADGMDAATMGKRERDGRWLEEIRQRLPPLLRRAIAPLRSACGRGTVVTDAADATASARALLASVVADSCPRVLAEMLPELVEAQMLQPHATGQPLTEIDAERIREVAVQCGLGRGQALVARLRQLVASAGRTAADCAALAAWVGVVVRGDAPAVLAPGGLSDAALRQCVRLVASVGTDPTHLSRQPGSVLGVAAALTESFAAWLPLGSLTEPLLDDLRDVQRWRTHPAAVWVLGSLMANSAAGPTGSVTDLCDTLLAVLDELTSTPHFWQFDADGAPWQVEHRRQVCGLIVRCFSDAACALFSADGGAARSSKQRDRFLLSSVYPLLEKAADRRHPDLASTASGVLGVVAVKAGVQGSGKGRTAQLVFESFDWVVDAVVSRFPFVAEYPATPRVLSAALRMLSDLLGTDGAPRGLLNLLDHVLRQVVDELEAVRPGRATRVHTLSMVWDVSELLSRSVRLRQAKVYGERLPERVSSAAVVTMAAAVFAWRSTGGADEEGQEPQTREVEPCTEESVAVATERRLLRTVLERLRHHLTAPDAAALGAVCNAARQCVVGFASFDGVSDRLQAGRRVDDPSPEIVDGAVVDAAERWWNATSRGDQRAGETAFPRHRGGLCSDILHFIHLSWSPLLARLLPPGFGSVADLEKVMTPAHRRHLSSVGVRVRLLKWQVPTVDLGACAVHVAQTAAWYLVYARDFVEDRSRRELWPLLRHHLIASPHVFHEAAGASQKYLAATASARFQSAVLRLLQLLVPPGLEERTAAAAADAQTHRFDPDRADVLLPFVEDVADATERFADPRQPQTLRREAAALHARIDAVKLVCARSAAAD